MRNASDIFCLNEDITDGMQMFSVNGSCPMRIRRRMRNQENDVFEYGRNNNLLSEEPNPEMAGRGDVEREMEIPPGDSARDDLESIISDRGDLEVEAINKEAEAAKSPMNGASKSSPTKLVNKKESIQRANPSNMERNPLTGAGIELPEHRRSKKALREPTKWSW
ncbi:unnamed protein product [Callosobruchus maculatus]|uniref:Uncharacterized protein n=1 Tax=Callosobruchus maculatus TaxID=64391 RepID=A0A653BIU1_CALMS|nr:unnamed protein product [Callosobruchus maculatus]